MIFSYKHICYPTESFQAADDAASIYRGDKIRVMKLGKLLPNPNRNWVEVELITNSLLLLFT